MKDNPLTEAEKATLLATLDDMKREDFNQKFLDLLQTTEPPKIEEIDDRIRRSIIRFVGTVESEEETALLLSDDDPTSVLLGKVTTAWLHGYMVALKWKATILRKPNTPPSRD